jgi:hypothetical protein
MCEHLRLCICVACVHHRTVRLCKERNHQKKKAGRVGCVLFSGAVSMIMSDVHEQVELPCHINAEREG